MLFRDLQNLMVKGNLNEMKNYIERSQDSQLSPDPGHQYDNTNEVCGFDKNSKKFEDLNLGAMS